MIYRGLTVLLLLLLAVSQTWAVDTKISALTAASAAAAANEFEINEAGASKKVTLTQIKDALDLMVGGIKIYRLGTRYTNSTTTGTEVTGIGPMTVSAAGDYYLECRFLTQSAATTTSTKFAVNYTGTTTRFAANTYFPSAGVTAATGPRPPAPTATTGQVWAYANTITEATTAPNMGPWIATTNAAANHLMHIDSLMSVSDTGDIEVWAAAEVAAEMSLEVGSFCRVSRLS